MVGLVAEQQGKAAFLGLAKDVSVLKIMKARVLVLPLDDGIIDVI